MSHPNPPVSIAAAAATVGDIVAPVPQTRHSFSFNPAHAHTLPHNSSSCSSGSSVDDLDSIAAAAASDTDKVHHQHKHRPIPKLLHLKGTKKRLVIALVGLPARGKTYLSRKLCRYLNWIGYTSAVFNVGTYRRQAVGSQPPCFFDPNNKDGVVQREEVAKRALEDMFAFLGAAGQAAIYDGTNANFKRRQMVNEYIAEQEKRLDIDVSVLWIELICTDPEVIAANIREARRTSPDSAGLTAEEAARSFASRIAQYEKEYEPLGTHPEELELSFQQNYDSGVRVINNRIEGYLMSKIAYFVSNLKVNRAPIYITRHGESQHNVKGLIGGDPYLSDNGAKYAEALANFIASEKEITKDELEELSVWTSTLKRTIQTAEKLKPLGLPITNWRALVEIQVGMCDNMTYAEIEQKYPEEFAARKRDKLRYRYPQGGESYVDVIQRIEPCILELERMSTPVLLVVHRAVARCFYSYFLDLPPSEIPHLDIPLHTVLKLVPKAYGCEVTRFRLDVSSVEDLVAPSPPPSAEEQRRAAEIAHKASAGAGIIPAATAEELQKSKEKLVHVPIPPASASAPPSSMTQSNL